MKSKDLQKLVYPLAKRLINQEYDSEVRSQEIRKNIIEHRKQMEERRKKFNLIRNK